jgi:peptide chain release factor 2
MQKPDFWQDQEAASKVLSELKRLKRFSEPLIEIDHELEEAGILYELAVEEDDEDSLTECSQKLDAREKALEKLQFSAMLSGPQDGTNAYLSVQAGAGGTESCDWAAMLLRMYSHWAEANGYETKMLDNLPGEETGIKKAELFISGPYAYGYLRGEIGVHRLVRISPFDAQSRRHTSFAAVDVLPELDDIEEIEIDDKDLRVDTYRASGAGGQHVNKVSSAVRITHLPTGIVVQCQNERSQHANRRTAMNMLTARLYREKEKEREKELAQLYSEKGEIAWGNQIRSYVLCPYTMVKDHRTGETTSNVQAVLDGNIEDFIQSYLKWRVENKK